MKRDKKKVVYFSGIERVLYKIFVLIVIVFIILIVCSETRLAQVNLELQKLTGEVDEKKKVNESLEMKIDEMTSLEYIKAVTEEYGLEYFGNRIKTIE